TGGIYWSFDGESHFQRRRNDLLKPPGEWNQMEIIARGSLLHIVVNGKQAVEADLATVAPHPNALPGVTRDDGCIALGADRGEVWYRQIEIKELRPASSVPDHGRLGITVRTGLRGEARLDQVVQGGPADQAKLQRGDRILAINEQEVIDLHQFRAALSS